MKILSIGKYKTLIKVDDEDVELLQRFNWSTDPWSNHRYAYRHSYSNNKKIRYYLHRVIMNAPKGMEVDHINGDTCDNQKSNLRIVTSAQNKANVPAKGVYWHKAAQKWCIQIRFNNKRYYLGLFVDKEEADAVYHKKVKEIKGEFAR